METACEDIWVLLVSVLREQGVAVLLILWMLWFVTTRVWKMVAQEIVPAWLQRQAAAASSQVLVLETVGRLEQSFDRFVQALEEIAGSKGT